MTKQSRKLLTSLGVFSREEELESRYHVRLERYVKDMLIEMHTLREMVDTLVLPAAFEYSGSLATVGGAREERRASRRDSAGRRGERRSATMIADAAEAARDARQGDRQGRGDARRSGEAGGAAHVGGRGRDGGGARDAAMRSSCR